MPNAADILWFKQNFQRDIEAAVAGTPFTVDMITAIACQETGYIWSALRKKGMSIADILKLCVGDTLDRTSTFPKNKADLLSAPNGAAMFAIARQALVDMAKHVPGYSKVATNPNKFCHGYGLFQYDIQFFKKEDPQYFLQRRYEQFGQTLGKCLSELRSKARRIGMGDKTSLTDLEFCAVAIAYNSGNYNPKKGLQQGHYNQTDGRYYGQNIYDFLRLAHTVAPQPIVAAPPPGQAIIAAPTPVTATGSFLKVDTQISPLRVRSAPNISRPAGANVIAHLPDGHVVRAVTDKQVRGFLEIETSLNGAHIHGFAAKEFLIDAPKETEVSVAPLALTPPSAGIVAVSMPRREGVKRTGIASALDLSEPNMPGRKGTTPAELCAELDAIVAYLAVDKAAHKRYAPRDGLTFCNIYAHDYCFLAGVYLPRVWWTPGAIERLARGDSVEPKIGSTIAEMRANDLFRWLRDFGARFGWRQTSTPTKVQNEANQGAIGLIVARRKQDGRSGHIVLVVPESADHKARRNSNGDVIAPLQSQAGTRNFQYGTGTVDWWRGDQFAESAFWIHA